MDSSQDSDIVADVLETPGASNCPTLYHAGFRHDPDLGALLLSDGADTRVLVVDAYGGAETALAWLARAPAEVRVAAHVDPEGVGMLLALEVEAAACLERLEVLRLLGLLRGSRSERVEMYLRLREALPSAARTFWDRNRSVLAAGIYNSSAEATLGRLLRNLLSTTLSAESYRTLLYGEREERLALFDQRIARSAFWRSALRLCAVRGQLAAPNDRSVDAFSAGDPVAALRRMVDVGLWATPLWARAFCNDTGVLSTLPGHFRPEGFAAMQAHLDRLDPDVDDLATTLGRSSRPFDVIDLGNLPDYLDADAFTELLGRLTGHLVEHGRLTYAGVGPTASSRPPAGLVPEPDLEARVEELDRAPLHGPRRVFSRRAA